MSNWNEVIGYIFQGLAAILVIIGSLFLSKGAKQESDHSNKKIIQELEKSQYKSTAENRSLNEQIQKLDSLINIAIQKNDLSELRKLKSSTISSKWIKTKQILDEISTHKEGVDSKFSIQLMKNNDPDFRTQQYLEYIKNLLSKNLSPESKNILLQLFFDGYHQICEIYLIDNFNHEVVIDSYEYLVMMRYMLANGLNKYGTIIENFILNNPNPEETFIKMIISNCSIDGGNQIEYFENNSQIIDRLNLLAFKEILINSNCPYLFKNDSYLKRKYKIGIE